MFVKNFHPITDLLWFCGILIFTLFVRHPFFSLCSLGIALLFNLVLKNVRALKMSLFAIPVFILLSTLNPIVSPWGQTVLFTIFGKPFTKEAFFYGLNTGLTFVVMIEWFCCFNRVMTSEKFTYLFAPVFPAVSLMLVMIFRMVPLFTKRVSDIKNCRKTMHTSQHGIKEAFIILNAALASVLEDGVMTATSMQKRGYGKTRRTNFLCWKWHMSDFLTLAVLALLAIFITLGTKNGSCRVDFYPAFSVAKLQGNKTLIFFCLFLAFPVLERIFYKGFYELRNKF